MVLGRSGRRCEAGKRRDALCFSLLGAETPNYKSPLEKETLPEDGDMPEQEAGDAPT